MPLPSVTSTVASAASHVKVSAAAAAKDVAATAAQAKTAAAASTKGAVATATSKVKDGARKAEDEARHGALKLLQGGLDRALPRVNDSVRGQLIDPDMPAAVRHGVGALVDAVVLEIRDVLQETLGDKLLRKAPDERLACSAPPICGGESRGPCGALRALRARILYALFPADRSIWARMKSWAWWGCFLLSVFPVLGVRVAWWALLFALADKRDEYTLCSFIISFKGSLFIGSGLLQALYASALYTVCLEANDCAEGGAPGSRPPHYEVDLCAALLQHTLCLVAWACLPWASAKGGTLYFVPPAARARGREGALKALATLCDGSEATQLARTKGGRLRYLLLYDTLVLSACLAGGLYAWFGSDDPAYLVRARVFHIKMLYGLLAFPWALLKLPLAWTLVLHLKPTGYNRRGEVVGVARAAERERRRQARHGTRARKSAKVAPSEGEPNGEPHSTH